MTEASGWPTEPTPAPAPDPVLPVPEPAPEQPATSPAPEPPAEPTGEVQEPGWLRDVADTAPVVAVALREILKLVGG